MGRLKGYYKEWEKITKNAFVLNTIKGYRIPLKSKPIQLQNCRKEINNEGSDKEMQSLISKQAIIELNKPKINYIFPISGSINWKFIDKNSLEIIFIQTHLTQKLLNLQN